MSDTVEHLMEVEKKARQIVEKAREEAADIIDRARREARDIVREATDDARGEADQIIEQKQAEAEKKREQMLQEARDDSPRAEQLDGEKLRTAVHRVVRVIARGEDVEQR